MTPRSSSIRDHSGNFYCKQDDGAWHMLISMRKNLLEPDFEGRDSIWVVPWVGVKCIGVN